MSASRNILHTVTLIESEVILWTVASLVYCRFSVRHHRFVASLPIGVNGWWLATTRPPHKPPLYATASLHFNTWNSSLSLFYDYFIWNMWWMKSTWGAKQDTVASRGRSSATTPSSRRCDWMIPEVLGHLPKDVFRSFWCEGSVFAHTGTDRRIGWRVGTSSVTSLEQVSVL